MRRDSTRIGSRPGRSRRRGSATCRSESALGRAWDEAGNVPVERARTYAKGARPYRKRRLVLGRGLVTAEGESWIRSRRVAQPAFDRQRLSTYEAAITRATEAMLSRWTPRVGSRTPIDIAQETHRP